MDIGLIIGALPLAAVLALSFVLALASIELGSWVARRRTSQGKGEPEGPLAGVVGAVLGLLAFILAITFSMTASRFDIRKQLVLDDANAISGAYFKAGFLPAKHRDVCRKLLREYIGQRTYLTDPSELQARVERCEELQRQLNEETLALVAVDMDSDLRAGFVDAVQQVSAVHLSRKTVAMVYRIPSFIWGSLYALSALSMFVIGYQVGSAGVTRLWTTPLMALAFSLVIAMIAEMDQPGSQYMISQKPMEDVQRSIDAQSP